jgi:hypothetical protein
LLLVTSPLLEKRFVEPRNGRIGPRHGR